MKLILASLLIAAALPAHAEFMDGNTLLKRIDGDNAERVAAFSYISGVADGSDGVAWCPTTTISLKQIVDLTRNILTTVPEHRHRAADIYVRVALKRIAPCADKVKGNV